MSDAGPSKHWLIPDQVEGEWAARRALAAAIRRVSERCVTTEADADTLWRAASDIEAVADALPSGPSAFERFASGSYGAKPIELIDRTALMGRANPWAPPMVVAHVDGVSECTLTFAEVHVGAPGMAHGGAVAAVLDQLFGHALVMADRRGFTGRLVVRYLKPTPLHRPWQCRAWIEDVSGRRVTVRGEILHGETRLVESEALMVQMARERAQQIIRGVPHAD
jgi:acyl-coenzyme A thioesterase PaaI-like protein